MNHKEKFAKKKQDYATAIDIGTTKIVAIVGKKDKNGKIRILGTGSVPTPENSVKRGVVLNIEESSKAIIEAIAKAEEASGIKFQNAFVGIAGQHIKSQQNSHSKLIESHDKEIAQSDIDKLINEMYSISLEPGEEIIHVIPQNYSVDNETGVLNPVGMYGRKIVGNYHIVIGEVTSANNIKKSIQRAGIQVNDLILEPIASSAAVLTSDEKEAGVVLIDIGGGTTDIAIFYDNILRHTAVIPYGGNAVTQDIKVGCNILQRYAEEVKIKYGHALAEFAPKQSVAVVPGISGRDPKEIDLNFLALIIQSRMEEIIGIICFEIENSGYKEKLSAGIALTGGGSMLKNLNQLMKYKTGLDVRIAQPVNYLSSDVNDDVKSPKFSTAVGLVVEGFNIMEKGNPIYIDEEIIEEIKEEFIPIIEPIVIEKTEQVNPIAENLQEKNNKSAKKENNNQKSSMKDKFSYYWGKGIKDLFDTKDTDIN